MFARQNPSRLAWTAAILSLLLPAAGSSLALANEQGLSPLGARMVESGTAERLDPDAVPVAPSPEATPPPGSGSRTSTYFLGAAWTPLTSVARRSPAWAYDPTQRRVYLAGGFDGRYYLADVQSLELDGDGRWRSLLLPGCQVDEVEGAAMVVDSRRGRLLLNGGYNVHPIDAAPGYQCRASDRTDAIDLAEGKPGTISGWGIGQPPPPRFDHAALWDPLRDRMLIFGGTFHDNASPYCWTNRPLSDLWEMSAESPPVWRALTTIGEPPPAGVRGTLLHDRARDRALFVSANRIWSLSLGPEYRFIEIRPAGTGPSAAGPAAIDARSDRVLVHSGTETFALDLSGAPEWRRVASEGPASRADQFAVFDDLRSRFLVLGTAADSCDPGPHASSLDFSVEPPRWKEFDVRGAASSWSSLVFDSNAERVLLVESAKRGGRFGDVWALDSNAPNGWTRIQSGAGAPSSRVGVSVAFDPTRNRLVLLGGAAFEGGTPFDEGVYGLPLDGTSPWMRIPVLARGVAQRAWAACVYDSKRDRLVLFGGRTSLVPSPLAWELPLGDPREWKAIAATGSGPAASAPSSGLYDPAGDRMILGQPASYGVAGGTWALEFQGGPRWVRLGAAPPGLAGGIALDTGRNRLLFQRGFDADQMMPSATSEFLLSVPGLGWRELGRHCCGWDTYEPIGRFSHGAVFDPVRDALILAGGRTPYFGLDVEAACVLADAWALDFNSPTRDIVVDFDPSSDVNSVGPFGRTIVGAVIFGARKLDVRQVDLVTVRVGLAPVERDLAGGFLAELADLNGDGWMDLTVKVRTSEIGLTEQFAPLRITALSGLRRVRLVGWDKARLVAGEMDSGRLPGEADPDPASVLPEILKAQFDAGSGTVRVSLALPAPGPARLELFDVSGRRVLVRELEGHSPSVREEMIDGAGRLRSGVYFLALSQQGRIRHARFALVR